MNWSVQILQKFWFHVQNHYDVLIVSHWKEVFQGDSCNKSLYAISQLRFMISQEYWLMCIFLKILLLIWHISYSITTAWLIFLPNRFLIAFCILSCPWPCFLILIWSMSPFTLERSFAGECILKTENWL